METPLGDFAPGENLGNKIEACAKEVLAGQGLWNYSLLLAILGSLGRLGKAGQTGFGKIVLLILSIAMEPLRKASRLVASRRSTGGKGGSSLRVIGACEMQDLKMGVLKKETDKIGCRP